MRAALALAVLALTLTVPALAQDGTASASAATLSAEEQQIIASSAESHQFEAEVGRLMSIIIHSLYTENEVFLRELVSNAADALDKIRFISLTDKAQLDSEPELRIQIKADPESRTLTITDTGIGMSKQELIKNLGRIAQSGTREFLSKISESASASSTSLIGQFGVGFYSAFLVADRVTVTSKSNSDPVEYVWTSTAENSYDVFPNPKGNTLTRGTQITLHLKEQAHEYLETATVRRLIARYSSFINFPIYLWDFDEVEKIVPNEEAAQQGEEAESQGDEEDEEIPQTKTIKEQVWSWKQLNDLKPLWLRPREEITEQDYFDFYKAISKDTENPMAHLHFNAEGEIDFRALIFVPSVAPSHMFDQPAGEENAASGKALRLYVKRVFITDNFDDILPKYLSFIRGIIDSDDVPLNVSRETLQHLKTLQMIKKKLVRKVIQLVQDIYDDKEQPERYRSFWKQYATNIKLGVIEDTSNRSRMAKLLLFHSSKTGDLTSLDEYVGRMKQGQKQIYYLGGESIAALEKSPLVEKLVKRGYEVLFMTEPIDEYAIGSIPKYDGEYGMTNVARDSLRLDDEETDFDRQKEQREQFEQVIDMLRSELSEFIDRVVISTHLVSSPVAVVSPQWGYTANMERVLRAQALADPSARTNGFTKKVLEINPNHPIIKELKSRLAANPEDEAARISAKVLYQTAALASGYEISNPSDFSHWVHSMMQLNLGIPINAVAEEEEEEAEPEAKDLKEEL
jgi:heat shock protein beta